GEVLNQPEQLRQLLAATASHLYVSGHHHAYFPSKVGGTNLLSLGAMGSGPRRRLNDSSPPEQTLTVLDLFEQRGEVVTTTLELNGLQVVRPTSLPGALTPSTGPQLRRRDQALKLDPVQAL
ncbi:MAG: metallophosphoesterase, partial [Prochlorococcaceae cyanobacterium]